MSLLEKFFKKQKEPAKEDIYYKVKREIQHCQQVLEDGKLYSTEKAEIIFACYGRTYFKTAKSNFFSAGAWGDRRTYTDEDGNRIIELYTRYYDLKLESEMSVKQNIGKYVDLYKEYFGEPEEG